MGIEMLEGDPREKFGFGPAELREKYREERDRRLREDANEQYIEVVEDFATLVDDPYCERVEREPLADEVEVAVIGGGFGGLLMGGRLKEAGYTDVRVIESGGDFGGTWYWNRYPGAMCDVESYCYLPMLEELDYIPKHKYSFAPEIAAHTQAIGKHFNLHENACLHTSVTAMTWLDEDKWLIETDRD
jgi:heterodisulfide reductase subunit A-like polyferredoxin